jgi:hypothetical protein
VELEHLKTKTRLTDEKFNSPLILGSELLPKQGPFFCVVVYCKRDLYMIVGVMKD